VDWWRAKLVLIAAFFLLNLALGWQVKQLLPPASGVLPPVTPQFGDETVRRLPLLTVETADPQGMVPTLLTDWTCADMSPQPDLSRGLGRRCRGVGGDTLDQWGGLLVYTRRQRLVGTRIFAAAQAIAETARHQMQPDPNLTLPFTGGQWDESTQTWKFSTVEKYANDILFNGTLQIDVGSSGITMRQVWINVLPGRPGTEAQQIIPEYQALQQARLLLGTQGLPAAGDRSVLLGYYSPSSGQPASEWTVNPAWRIRNRGGQCFYINAYTGEVEALGIGVARLQPQAC